jgi:hypothetical protein
MAIVSTLSPVFGVLWVGKRMSGASAITMALAPVTTIGWILMWFRRFAESLTMPQPDRRPSVGQRQARHFTQVTLRRSDRRC